MSETETLAAGRPLDVEVARKIFKIKDIRYPDGHADWPMHIPSGKPWRTHAIDAVPIPHYSTSIEAAWTIVERCTAVSPFGYQEINGLPLATRFVHAFEQANLWACSASEAAEWICRIALSILAALEAQPDAR